MVEQDYNYGITSFCEHCWKKAETARKEKAKKKEQIVASYNARVASMLDKVLQIPLTFPALERVPIIYAVDKCIKEVQPEQMCKSSQKFTPRMTNEVLKICSDERIPFDDALRKYFLASTEAGAVRTLNRFIGSFREAFQRDLTNRLSKELQIEKIRNR